MPGVLSKPEIGVHRLKIGVHRHSRLRGNDVTQKLKFDKTVAVTSVTGEGPLGGFAAVAVRGQVQSAVSHH